MNIVSFTVEVVTDKFGYRIGSISRDADFNEWVAVDKFNSVYYAPTHSAAIKWISGI